MSINLSAQSLGANGIGRYVMDKLVEFNVDPPLVTFEITETKAVTNLDAARELISQLRGLGCRFALDDFGCGFSSFTHLKHLDVDFLKIDGSFIQGLLEDPVDRAVITAINDSRIRWASAPSPSMSIDRMCWPPCSPAASISSRATTWGGRLPICEGATGARGSGMPCSPVLAAAG
jgi:hypothetical protein